MKKVLLIEDDRDQVNLYTVRLLLEKFEVTASSNGEDGIIKAKEWEPNIILLDIKMEGIDGIEVLKRLKADDKTKDIPVVMLTNVVKKDIAESAKKLGALDLWSKVEVMPSDVVKKCKEILD